MIMDEHTKACLLAILDGKQMQREFGGKWEDASPEQVFAHLTCKDSIAIRIKPESQVMCELAGVQYPMPMQEAPENGAEVWIAYADGEAACNDWRNTQLQRDFLAANLLHETEEAARTHSRAMHAANAQAVAKAKEQA